MQPQKPGTQPNTDPTSSGDRFPRKPGDQVENERNRQDRNPNEDSKTGRPETEEERVGQRGGASTNNRPSDRQNQKDKSQQPGQHRPDQRAAAR
jgi:hypothetical protein